MHLIIKMIVLQHFPISTAKFKTPVRKLRNLPPNYAFRTSILQQSKFIPKEASIKYCCCKQNDNPNEPYEGFSVLLSNTPWESKSILSNFCLYLFSLHIPLSFGGVSAVAKLMNCSDLDPQTEAVSLFFIQVVELFATLIFLRLTAKPEFEIIDFFRDMKVSLTQRNWLLGSLLGFGFLISLVLLTSFLTDNTVGFKAVNDPVLKDILLNSDISKTACILVYCIIIPLLEETIYRGFLLTSLSSTMKWYQAIFISSAIFSAAHFSGENFIQLFVIGCVLGCSYCWTGNLTSSIVIHSLYNAVTLLATTLS